MTKIFPRMMLVDMNSFFASVEQQANPALRGKPIGVSPSSHPGSCLIGTSREAKAMGIKNGIPLYKARKICPKIIAIKSEPEKYREVNRQMNQIFYDYTDKLETYSIDESFLDLSSSKLNPLEVGRRIKQRIRSEIGEWLTCSIGIAENRFLAKLAADMQKPDGLTVIWREHLRQIYQTKKFPDLWGINRGWTKRLARLGLTNPAELLDYPVQNLISMFGKPGYHIWERVNGLEIDEIGRSELDPKSFGHSWVLNFRTTDKEKLKIAVYRLAEKAARRMRRENFMAREIHFSVRLVTGEGFHRSKRLNFYVETGAELYEEALAIWRNWDFSAEVMHIAVGFTGLQKKMNQLSLFEDKSANLTPTIDAINDKYGEFMIRSGLLTKTSEYAPDAIAFGK